MALSSRRIRGRAPSADYWPGFVDAMSSLLLVLIFLLTIFMLVQFYLSQLVSSQDNVLQSLRSQIAELASQLALEQREQADLRATIASLQESLGSATAEQDRLQGIIAAQGDGSGLAEELSEQKRISEQAQAEVALLNQQISALRRQLATLERALDAAETKDEEQKAQIADLGRRLNVALAQKVQELARYRSEFFGRLREVLKSRSEIEVVGDRFVIQSEILFSSGSAQINRDALGELSEIADVIKQLETEIPSDIPWVLRVDGHTDDRPIATAQYPSNWYLSAARAISVVTYLTEQGVDPKRLVAAGFGEYQPLARGDTPADLRRNRRIEFKLTER